MILNIIKTIKNVLLNANFNVVLGLETDKLVFPVVIIEPERSILKNANIGIYQTETILTLTCIVSAQRKNFEQYFNELENLINNLKNVLIEANLNSSVSHKIEFVEETYSEFYVGSEKVVGGILEIKIYW